MTINNRSLELFLVTYNMFKSIHHFYMYTKERNDSDIYLYISTYTVDGKEQNLKE